MTTLNAPTGNTRSYDLFGETATAASADRPVVVSTARQRRADERSFVLLLLLSFPFFLLLAIGARLMSSNGTDTRSVFAVATEAARSTLAIALNL